MNPIVDEQHYKRLLESGASLEEILSELRRKGLSKVESIAALARISGMPPGRAKKVVHHSRAWSDLREDHERFEESLGDALEEGLTSDEDLIDPLE